jgi:hypothetical protein
VTVAVVVLAVVVVALAAGWALDARRRHQRQAATAAERDRLARLVGEVEARLEQASARLDALDSERARLEERLDDAEATTAELGARAEAADGERDRLERAVDELRAERDRLARTVDDLGGARGRQGGGRAGASGPAAGRDEALWALELARSERTWRHSVAPVPVGPSPFTQAADPLRLAVEVEAAALREEVGAPLEIRWQAEVDDPARCLLVLRLAQELLAAAARQAGAAVLEVRGSGEVVLDLTGEDGEPVEVEAPPVPAGLVRVEHPGHGLRLVITR